MDRMRFNLFQCVALVRSDAGSVGHDGRMQLNLMRVVAWTIALIASSAMAQEFEYFSVQVGSADGAYNPDQVVSREAIPNNAWYQMESKWRVAVDAGSEAYVVNQANVAQNQFIVVVSGWRTSSEITFRST